jgi:hypothetical protein
VEKHFFTLLDKVFYNKILNSARYMPVFMVKMNGFKDIMEIHIRFVEYTSVCIEIYLFSSVDLLQRKIFSMVLRMRGFY